MWYVVTKVFLISAAIPIGFSIGFFISAYIVAMLGDRKQEG